MTALQYIPAVEPKWLVMIAGSEVLFVDGGVAKDRLEGLWHSLSSSASAQDLLDELTRGGISKTPAFALLTVGGDLSKSTGVVHAIVRGPLSVSVYCDEGVVRVAGGATTTWAESTVKTTRGFEVAADGRTGDSARPRSALPLLDGVAIASQVSAGSTTEPNVLTDASDAPSFKSGVKPEAVEPKSQAGDPYPPSDAPKRPAVDRSQVSEATVSEVTVAEMAPDDAQVPEPPASPSESAGVDDSGYDYLFGETIARTVEDAAVRETEDPPNESDPAGGGDHDGKTSIGLDRAARQAARRARAERTSVATPVAVTMSIELSTGRTELLDQPILIGRAPSVSKVSGASLPRLVTISGPDLDISRNHVQVSLEGGTVVVTDLHSRNGTMIVLPGRPPQQLRAGEPTSVISGTMVDLGSGITFTVREK